MKLKPESIETSEPTEAHIIDHIIALISLLLWPHSSKTSSPVTHAPEQPGTGLQCTNMQPCGTVKNQLPSNSTTSTKNMVDQKKADGGTKSVKRTKPIASSQRSNVSTDSSTLPKTSVSTNNHPFMTAEVLPPYMPHSVQDTPWIIPPSGLTIARHL